MSDVRREDVLKWLDEIFFDLRRSPQYSLLTIDGVDVLEALRSPLYSAVLNAARSGRPLQPQTVLNQLTAKAYRYKQLAQEMIRSHHSVPARQAADLVLWPRTMPHVKQLAPVYRALRQAGMKPLLLVSNPATADAVRARGLEAVHAWTELWPKLIRARRRGKAAALAFKRTPVRGEPRLWAEELHREIVAQLPLVHELTAIVRSIEQRARPSLFVVGNDITPEGRTACLALAGRLPVACLMHGIGSGNPLLEHHLADLLLVYGELNRDHLLKLGIGAERIRVVGAPYIDDLRERTSEIHPALRGEGPLVLMAVSGPGDKISLDHHRAVIGAMQRASREVPEARFFAKLHPKDRAEHYQGSSSRLTAVSAGAGGYPSDIFDWLQGTTVLVTGGSAVAMEAMLLDVPVITADFEGTLGGVDFIRDGATLHTKTPDELVHAVARACRDPGSLVATREAARRYLERKLGRLDGRASQRAAEALRELVLQARSRTGLSA